MSILALIVEGCFSIKRSEHCYCSVMPLNNPSYLTQTENHGFDLNFYTWTQLMFPIANYPTIYVVWYGFWFFIERGETSESIDQFLYKYVSTPFFSLHFFNVSQHVQYYNFHKQKYFLRTYFPKKSIQNYIFGIFMHICSILNSIMSQPMSEAFTLYGTIYLFSFENQPVDRQ